MSDEIKPTEEVKKVEEKPLNYEEVSVALYKQLQEYQFFSDQTKFNATLFQGFNILLDKVTRIEEKLNADKK